MSERKISRYFDNEEDHGEDRNTVAKAEEHSFVEDPMSVLLSTEFKSQSTTGLNEISDSDGSSDWEELTDPTETLKPSISGVTIKFDAGRLSADLDAEQKTQRELLLMWKRLHKTKNAELLKVFSLCFLAHGRHLSAKCNEQLLQAFAVSMLPIAFHSNKRRQTTKNSLSRVNQILEWYRGCYAIQKDSLLDLDFGGRTANSPTSFIQGLILVLRSLSIPTRILIHFWPKMLKLWKLKRSNQDKPSSSSSQTDMKPKKRKSDSAVDGKKKRKVSTYFSSDSDSESLDLRISPFGMDATTCWIEIFDDSSQKWHPVDPFSLKLTTPDKIESQLKFPLDVPKVSVVVAYVVAFDEGGLAVDVTPRYASMTLHTRTRKERGDAEQTTWWQSTLALLKPSGKQSEVEASELSCSASAEKHHVPTTIGALKSHPLYVLARDVHKYEAVYPADTQPVGFVKGEPVFDRSRVQGLHTREKWLLEGRQVREVEEPYKTVTGQRKGGKSSAKMVGLFGHWQTKQYEPPEIVDGKLPRNSYGNIEVFKPWMLPRGTCHMTIRGVQSTAKRLGIDYVPAMVGWDFHAGTNHPVLDGVIVAEDVRDVLECAWRQERQIAVADDLRGRAQRARANWRRLVKALLLRERLKDRYLS